MPAYDMAVPIRPFFVWIPSTDPTASSGRDHSEPTFNILTLTDSVSTKADWVVQFNRLAQGSGIMASALWVGPGEMRA